MGTARLLEKEDGMMMQNEAGVAFLFLIATGVFVGWLGGTARTDEKWRKDAIKRGYARYNETTGAWEWKE